MCFSGIIACLLRLVVFVDHDDLTEHVTLTHILFLMRQPSWHEVWLAFFQVFQCSVFADATWQCISNVSLLVLRELCVGQNA